MAKRALKTTAIEPTNPDLLPADEQPGAEESAPVAGRRPRRTSEELDAEIPPGSLAERVRNLMRERKISAKALSRRAGLTEDAVRALVRGRIQSPRARSLAQLAAALGLSVDDLVAGTGIVPLHVTETALADGARREVDVAEVDLRTKGGIDLPDDPRRVPRHRTWSIPVDLLDERGIAATGLVIARVAPYDRFSATDRLLIDLSETRGADVLLVWQGGAYSLRPPRLQQPAGRGGAQDHLESEEYGGKSRTVGRVVAQWTWL